MADVFFLIRRQGADDEAWEVADQEQVDQLQGSPHFEVRRCRFDEAAADDGVRCGECDKKVHSTLTDQCPHCFAPEYGRSSTRKTTRTGHEVGAIYEARSLGGGAYAVLGEDETGAVEVEQVVKGSGGKHYIVGDRWCHRTALDHRSRKIGYIQPAAAVEELTMIALALKNQGVVDIEDCSPETGVERLIERLYATLAKDPRGRRSEVEAELLDDAVVDIVAESRAIAELYSHWDDFPGAEENKRRRYAQLAKKPGVQESWKAGVRSVVAELFSALNAIHRDRGGVSE